MGKTSDLNERIENILSAYSLRKTSLRREMLRLLMLSKDVVSQADLMQSLDKVLPNVDRVSLYRNLKEMKSNGIIHEVEINSYIACEHDCSKHPHLLLYCQNCQRHEEVTDHNKIAVFLETLGKFRFFSKDNSLSLRGICHSCGEE